MRLGTNARAYDMAHTSQDGERLGVPVTPTLDAATVVVKHRNEEGGLGYQAFGNACAGACLDV